MKSMYLNNHISDNKEYLRILESYSVVIDGKRKNRKRIIKNLGALSQFDDGNPDYFQRLRDAFKSGIALIPELEEFIDKSVPDTVTIKIKSNDSEQYLAHPKNIGYLLIEKVLEQLKIIDLLENYKKSSKITYDLVGIFKLLIIGRVLKPDSKIATVAQKENYLFNLSSEISDKDIYRSLDVLNKLNNKIQKKMDTVISKSAIGRNREFTYYDVTNFFFHIDQEDDFRKRGKSKEHRVEPIIQMGLFIDNNGIPIAHKEFPGNIIDQLTLRPAVKETIKDFSLDKIVVVADGGMNSGKNRAYLVEQGHGYIVSRSVKNVNAKTRKWILDESDYTNRNGSLPTQNEWKYKSRTICTEVKREDGKLQKLTEKEVVFFSPNYYYRELEAYEKFREYLEECCENPRKVLKSSAKSYLKAVDFETGEIKNNENLKYSINDEKLNEKKKIFGFYLIKTSEIELNSLDIIERYHGLSKIEDCFRITKSNLNGRPIYVRTEEHIKAHFLICFIALTIIRIIQVKFLLSIDKKIQKDGWQEGITAQKLQEGLNSWEASVLGEDRYRISEPTEELKEILEVFGIDWNMFLPNKIKIKRKFNNISVFGS
jgi:transposase